MSSRTARGTRPSGLLASRPSGVFSAGSMTGNSAITGTPSATHSSATAKRPVDAAPLHAGHAGHVLRLAAAVEHEDRQDQVLRRQPVFAHQVAAEGVAAQSARAAGGEGRRGLVTAGVSGVGSRATTLAETAYGGACRALIKSASDDSRKAVRPLLFLPEQVPCRMTAIRLTGPGPAPGLFFAGAHNSPDEHRLPLGQGLPHRLRRELVCRPVLPAAPVRQPGHGERRQPRRARTPAADGAPPVPLRQPADGAGHRRWAWGCGWAMASAWARAAAGCTPSWRWWWP